jgi:DNA-binding CsgD family transcriptional regulator
VRVRRTVLLYGLIAGVAIALLRFIEYRFLVLEHSLEIYGGLVALLFSGLGIWLGLKLTRPKVILKEVPVTGPFVMNEARLAELGITPRELEVLGLVAAGMTNKEIAAKLYVSENTVKTHAASVFEKLQAKRRTQAVQIAKQAGLIP